MFRYTQNVLYKMPQNNQIYQFPHTPMHDDNGEILSYILRIKSESENSEQLSSLITYHSLISLLLTVLKPKSHLCRLFKKAIGITVIDFINFVRIWNAENLLTSTDDKVLNISMDVGFSNISYFNRIFKKTTGMTPLAYKDIINANKTKKTLTHS